MENMVTTDSVPPRPILHERADYRPAYRHEEFIVPLLGPAIEHTLRTHCAPRAPTASAIDVGCGRQPFRPLLEQLGYEYSSIDTQQNKEQSVQFIGAIDEDLPAELRQKSPFQLILCTEVLEHVANWDRAFSNFAALLGPSGRLLITCPHVYPLHEVPYDFWRPTLFSLEHYARRAGFRTVLKQQLGDGWDVIGTTLGIANPTARNGSVLGKVLASLTDLVRWGIWLLLKVRFMQRFVSLGPMYISNLALFERE
jgi:SAM-dependent methyltransferase